MASGCLVRHQSVAEALGCRRAGTGALGFLKSPKRLACDRRGSPVRVLAAASVKNLQAPPFDRESPASALAGTVRGTRVTESGIGMRERCPRCRAIFTI